MKMRLQKFLSDAGVASRRKAEELIREGFVAVNDEIVDSLPAFVDPQK
ncbi:MAG: S4 domain-containing protein, partial [Phycisphaerae bacterium]